MIVCLDFTALSAGTQTPPRPPTALSSPPSDRGDRRITNQLVAGYTATLIGLIKVFLETCSLFK